MIQFVDEAKKLLSIDSTTAKGNEEIAVYCQSLMKRVGFKTTLQSVTHASEDISKKQFNVVGILGDPLVDKKIRKGLLLLSHLDTNDPGLDRDWKAVGRAPLALEYENEKLYGLGAAEAKLDFLCKLKASELFKDRNLKQPIYLVGTAAANYGSLGAKYLLKSGFLNPKYALVGAATGGVLAANFHSYTSLNIKVNFSLMERDSKGYSTRIVINSFGRSYHPLSQKTERKNAIDQLFQLMQALKSSNFDLKLNRIMGGGYSLRIPDDAKMEFYIKSSDLEDFKKFYREKLASTYNDDLSIEYGGVGESGISFLPQNFSDCVLELSQLGRDIDSANGSLCLSYVNVGVTGLDFRYLFIVPAERNLNEFEQQIINKINVVNKNYPSLMFKVDKGILSLGAKKHEFNTEGSKFLAHVLDQKTGLGNTLNGELSYLKASGVEAAAFGPGEAFDSVRTAEESVAVSDLDVTIQKYVSVIEKVCL